MTEERKVAVQRKNRNIVGKYLALHLENADKLKAMATFTGISRTLKETKKIVKAFTVKVNLINRRKSFQNNEFKYFSNIEFGKDAINNRNIHAHTACFIDSLEPLHKAFEYVIKKFGLDRSKCNLSIANDHTLSFSYVIKDYLPENFNEELEDMKDLEFGGKAMHSSSQKEIPNYVIRKIYFHLSKLPEWSGIRNKYAYMIELIEKGVISVKKATDGIIDGYKKLRKWIYKISYKTLVTQTYPHTINYGSQRVEKLNYVSMFIFALTMILLFLKGSVALNVINQSDCLIIQCDFDHKMQKIDDALRKEVNRCIDLQNITLPPDKPP